ncbi:MAG TPA: DUF3857 domain-containing protein [Candidatus Acidoferrales bacterium]|nr:DUF3857 domain-containing protein [Candidatus Acidoferrales bacterium]
MRPFRNLSVLCLLLAAIIFPLARRAHAAADWPAISQSELAMKENPAEPGAPAMILYREDVEDGNNFVENAYSRIKIFSDEGKKYADIEVPFIRGIEEVKDVHARTIHPDGKVIESDAKVMEKLLIKSGEIKILAKTFTLPDVTPGSVIEYRYKVQREPALYDCTWQIQEELYTRRAHFGFMPNQQQESYGLLWRTFRSTASPQKQKDGSYALDINDVPGVPDEEYMLPEDEVRGKIEFIYTKEDRPKDAKGFWDQTAKEMNDFQEKFVGKRPSVRDLVSQTIKTDDTPEVKLQKLYARAQQVHNTTDDPEKTAQEAKRQKTKDNNNVDDVLKHGYGDSGDIDYLYSAMAQAAGFESSIVWVASRNKHRFHPEMQDREELNDYLVWVHAGDKEYFLDPGVHYCPFGVLPWYETEITALRPTKQGAVYLKIPGSPSSSSITERIVNVNLDPDGTLSGTLVVRFRGERAFSRRQIAHDEDQEGKKKVITDEVKGWLPSSGKFELTSITGWDNSDAPLEVQGKLKLPGMAESVGHRLLLPIGLYEAGQRQMFDASARKQDIYFHYPYEDVDDITIQLPAGWQAGTLPAPQVVDPGGQLKYEISAKQEGNSLRVQRRLVVGGIIYPLDSYSAVRKFFSTAKSNDEQQLVLQAAASGNN